MEAEDVFYNHRCTYEERSPPSYSHFSTVLVQPFILFNKHAAQILYSMEQIMIYVYHFVAVIVGLLIHSLSIDSTVVNTVLREQVKTAKVMLCAIVKQEDLYIEEWLDYHRALGYDYVELYDNENLPSRFLATHFPGDGKQRQAYRTCVQRNNHKNMWSTFLDIDEFVVLRNHSSIGEFLRDVAPEGGAVVLNWSVFGCNGTVKQSHEPVLVRFVQSSAFTNKHFKTTAYLPHVLDPSIHNTYMLPFIPTVTQHGVRIESYVSWDTRNDREIANINHYLTKTLEEFKLKRLRGRGAGAKKNAKNDLYFSGSREAIEKEIKEFDELYKKNAGFPIRDTVARDFYLKNVVGVQ
jgi:hypothetical protein